MQAEHLAGCRQVSGALWLLGNTWSLSGMVRDVWMEGIPQTPSTLGKTAEECTAMGAHMERRTQTEDFT